MIDLASGTLFFDDGTEVDPRVERPHFLTSKLELPETSDEKSAPPWTIYTLAPRLLDGIHYGSRLSFKDDALELLAIWNADIEEAKRAERHDVWMMKNFGAATAIHPWGKVEAITEPSGTSGGASIILFSYL
jgi:hypothetical protein